MESEGADRKERSRLPMTMAAGALVVLLVAGGLVRLARFARSHGSSGAAHMPFGPAEQAAAQRVHFSDIHLARSTNMLNQEFTYVTGAISNDGVRNLRGLEVLIEFHDPFNQVILRDSERLIGPRDAALGGGRRRDFQVTLEHVPAEWNREYPTIAVTGLVLE